MEKREISSDELVGMLKRKEPVFLLDVRTDEEFERGKIRGAHSIWVFELPARFDELPKDRDTQIVVYCENGPRAKAAAAVLTAKVLGDRKFNNIRILTGEGAWRKVEAALAKEKITPHPWLLSKIL